MKFILIFLLFLTGICKAQVWQAEVMIGASGYNGDLTQQRIPLKQLRPAINLNIKYNTGNIFNLRAGIAYGRVGANDKDNTSAGLKSRNLNFKSDIIELNLISELNLFDPESYTAYPYFFGGIGVFHFNPFTYDNNKKKTYLQPLSTEGEGLKEYPDRKKYSLTQFCIPIGFGWKFTYKEKWDISYEFGYRIIFTDYLDDVSKTYVDLNVLAAEKGPKAAELAYRGTVSSLQVDGHKRGNPSVNDVYFFAGIKIGTSLSNIFR